jgi:predicted nucleic acid-binding protein
MIALLDAGFLYALVDEDDSHSFSVKKALESRPWGIVLPIPAITETAYLVRKNLGQEALADFTASLDNTVFEFETPASSVYLRSAEILRKYNDQNIDFVDACIVAMAERLKITSILTVDRRHFSLFRPVHCDSFELLPE